jgi:hypothetical protein
MGFPGSPGTAKMGRPCWAAWSAVIIAPDRSAARTTTTASESAEMVRLRRGKLLATGWAPGANSLTTAPAPLAMRSKRSRFSGG